MLKATKTFSLLNSSWYSRSHNLPPALPLPPSFSLPLSSSLLLSLSFSIQLEHRVHYGE